MKNFKYLLIILAVFAFATVALSYQQAKAKHDDGGDNEHGMINGNGNDASGDYDSENQHEDRDHTPFFSIRPNGNVIASGASLVSSSGQSLAVKSFGVNLNVNLTSSTVVVGVTQGNASSSTGMQSGDILDIRGNIDPSSGAITATWIRDNTQQQARVQSIRQQIQALFDQLKRLQEQLRLQTGGSNWNG